MFAALAYFVGSYLHQDWVDDYGDLQTAIGDYTTHESAALRAQLLADIDAVLLHGYTEAALRRLLIDQMDSNYRAEVDGLTYRSWLERVRAILLEPSEG